MEPTRGRSATTGWVAWAQFAALLLVMLGAVHLATGLIALARPEVLAGDRADMLLPIGLTAVAWIHVGTGVVAAVAGVGLYRGLGWARPVATVLACVALLVNFAFLGVHPLWSAAAIFMAATAIYAIVVHGGEAR